MKTQLDMDKIAALGFGDEQSGCEILLSTEQHRVLADASLRAVYPMWLRQIARAAVASSSCLNIVRAEQPHWH